MSCTKASHLQGDPNQKLQLQMAVTLKVCISEPTLVKPKCVSGVADFSSFQLLVTIFSCLFTIFSCLFTIFQTKLAPLNPILALPT